MTWEMGGNAVKRLEMTRNGWRKDEKMAGTEKRKPILNENQTNFCASWFSAACNGL